MDARDQMVFGAMNAAVQTVKLLKETTKTVENKTNDDTPIAESSANPTPNKDKAESDPTPELSIVEATEESKVPASVTEAPKKKSKVIQPEKEIVQGIPNDILNSLSVDDIYDRLMECDEYYPIVKDIKSMSDDELDRAYRCKLISDALTPDRFLFTWALSGKTLPRSYKEQYMIKAKNYDTGLKYVLDFISKRASAHHSMLQKDYCDFLARDEAMYEAKKAKEEADRKAKAAENAKKAKEKAKSKKSKTTAKSTKSAKADKKEASKPKTSSKKTTAPKAATDESVISLFNMM